MKAPFSVVPRTSPSTQGLAYLKPATPDLNPLFEGMNRLSRGLLLAADEVDERKSNIDEMEANSSFTNYESALWQEQEAAKRGPEGMRPDFTKLRIDSGNASREHFLSTIPEPLRPKYAAKLDETRARLTLDALDFQYKQQDAQYEAHADDALSKARVEVYDNPSEALRDAKKLEVAEQINASDLPPLRKQAKIDNANAQLETVYYAAKSAGIYRKSREASSAPTSLAAAVEWVESGGRPGAVSSAGAIGLMQVMPETAAEIARDLGDVNFPVTGQADVAKYLSDPAVSRRYGRYYLNQQINAFPGDIEAALIAYNGGPGRAREFLASGRNWSVLPQETQDYVPKVLKRMQGGVSMPQFTPGTMISQEQFDSVNYTWEDFRNDRFPDAQIDSGLVGALDSVTETFGKGKLRLTSGYRSPEYNERASFTGKTGQHTKGTAIDIDVSGYTDAEKERLVQLFVASGARGIGHYANGSLHVDFRPGAGNGPGGLALWYGEKNYKEGEEWFIRGIENPLTPGAMAATGFEELDNDPGVANVPLEARLSARQDAISRVNAEMTAEAGARETARKQEFDKLLQNEAFGIPSQTAINAGVMDGRISGFEERSKIQKVHDDRLKEMEGADGFLQKANDGSYVALTDNKLFNDYIGAVGAQRIDKMDTAYVNEQIGHMQTVHDVPTVMVSKLEGMIRGANSKWAYEQLIAIQNAVPEAADDRFEEDLRKKVNDYRNLRDAGLLENEDIQGYLHGGGKTEAQRQATPKLDADSSAVLNADHGSGGTATNLQTWTSQAVGGIPADGSIPPETVQMMERGYRTLFQEKWREFANQDLAKQYADAELPRIWSDSMFAGNGTYSVWSGTDTGFMRWAPENVYPGIKTVDVPDFIYEGRYGNESRFRPYLEQLHAKYNVLTGDRIELEADATTKSDIDSYRKAVNAGVDNPPLPSYVVFKTFATTGQRVRQAGRWSGEFIPPETGWLGQEPGAAAAPVEATVAAEPGVPVAEVPAAVPGAPAEEVEAGMVTDPLTGIVSPTGAGELTAGAGAAPEAPTLEVPVPVEAAVGGVSGAWERYQAGINALRGVNARGEDVRGPIGGVPRMPKPRTSKPRRGGPK